MPPRALTIALLSDHEPFRQVVAQRLADQGFGSVVHVASMDKLVAAARRKRIDVAVIDADQESEELVELVRGLRRELPAVHIIAMSTPARALTDEALVLDTEALDRAAMVTALAPRLRGQPDDNAAEWARITDRQHEVMRWLAVGLDNAAIGQKLKIGERAVKAHVSSLLDLFNLNNRTQLALLADRAGLRPPRR